MLAQVSRGSSGPRSASHALAAVSIVSASKVSFLKACRTQLRGLTEMVRASLQPAPQEEPFCLPHRHLLKQADNRAGRRHKRPIELTKSSLPGCTESAPEPIKVQRDSGLLRAGMLAPLDPRKSPGRRCVVFEEVSRRDGSRNLTRSRSSPSRTTRLADDPRWRNVWPGPHFGG